MKNLSNPDLVNDSIVNNIVTEDLSDNGKSYGQMGWGLDNRKD